MPQVVSKLPAQKAAAFDRLRIVIDGIADRVSSAVDSLADEMTAAGASPDAIKTRIEMEMKSGRILSEMRDFAKARVPGFAGDMAFRFARDTLSDKQKQDDFRARLREEKETLKVIEDDKTRGMSAMEEETLSDRQDQAQAIIEAMQTLDIDIGAYVGDQFPEPPPDAPLTDGYLWIAVKDKNTCEICEGNHGEIKTLAEWSAIGEPRSGACLGESRCRCVLIPTSAVNPDDSEHLKDVVTVVKE
jgi:hypothetical protein